MKGVIVHGALLVVMLLYGYRTWTRDRSVEPTTGQIVVWDRSVADLESVLYTSSKKSVRVERRGQGADTYWWGIESRTDRRKKPSPPKATDAGVPAAAAAAVDAGVPAATDPAAKDAGAAAPPDAVPQFEEEVITTVTEFPIGTTGEDIIKGLAAMRALRALGPITEQTKKEYGLELGDTTLAITFKGGTRTFVIGNKVSGGKERYALDPDSGKGYVVSGTFIDPLDSGGTQLRPADPKGIDATLVASVEVKAKGKSRKAIRMTTSGDKGAQTKTWGDGSKPDQTLANFIDNVDRLRASQFEPDLKVTDLTPVVELSYLDERNKKLATLTLYKRDKAGDLPTDGTADPTAPPPTVTEYYMVTEKTRVPAVVSKASAERIDQDVATLLP